MKNGILGRPYPFALMITNRNLFSVSNCILLYLHKQSNDIVLGQVDHQRKQETVFSGKNKRKKFLWKIVYWFLHNKGYFKYQLQTGVVLAFDSSGRLAWSSEIKAPIAGVWELKNGQLNEKALFETTASNRDFDDDPSEI